MRLLNVHSLDFKTFNHVRPPYAIASHRWGGAETTFQHVRDRINCDDAGYQKVVAFASYIREFIEDIEWLWIDTCCIDKTNSQELQEAITAMYKWYEGAFVCLAYLEDIKSQHGEASTGDNAEELRQSVWFTRGWTLQELLAPRLVVFLSRGWNVLGHKAHYDGQGHPLSTGPRLNPVIASITNISEAVLAQPERRRALSMEQRLGWVATRTTTRPEDIAYCLLGIFEVSMPLIYEEGEAAARRRLIRAIKDSQDDALDDIGSKHTASGSFRIPLNINRIPTTDYFVPRDIEYRQLEAYFQPSSGPARRSIFVVHGLGGMGKTQLCAHFVRDQQDRFTAILWLDGSSRDVLRQSLAGVAARLPDRWHLSVPNGSEPAVSLRADIDAVLHWLSIPRNTNWLVVFDNVDRDWQTVPVDRQAFDFQDFLPAVDHGNVLITTRLARLRRPDASIHLSDVEPDFGRKILEMRVGRALPDASLLVEKLGALPLALAQAGAYLDQTNMTISRYLQFYDATWSRLMLLQHQTPLQEYQQSIVTTWKISYDQIASVNPHAARLLDLWAFLNAGDVWFDLLWFSRDTLPRHGAPAWLCELAADELLFQHSIGTLSQYSLLTIASDRSSLSIHTVVHTWCLYNVLLEENAEELYAQAARIVAEATHTGNTRSFETARRLIPHTKALGGLVRYSADDQSLMKANHDIAIFLSNWESTVEAESLYLRVLQWYEKTLGPDDMSTLTTVHNVGFLYAGQGRLAEAEQLYRRALQGTEKALGADDVSTLQIANNLGHLLADRGNPVEAEQMYERALKGYEKVAPDSPSMLDTVHNLGLLYAQKGQRGDAEQMYQRALQGREKIFGPDHPLTLDTVDNLGTLSAGQGKIAEAERMIRRVLQGRERAFGPDHRSTLMSVNNLGVLLAGQGKLEEAEQLHQRALQGYEKAFGPHHTATLDTIINLSVLRSSKGDLSDAEQLCRRAMLGYEQALGADHSSTLKAMHNLAALCKAQNRLVEAEQMYLRALQGRDKALGPCHASTLGTACQLGIFYAEQGRLADSEQIYERISVCPDQSFSVSSRITLLKQKIDVLHKPVTPDNATANDSKGTQRQSENPDNLALSEAGPRRRGLARLFRRNKS